MNSLIVVSQFIIFGLVVLVLFLVVCLDTNGQHVEDAIEEVFGDD